MTNLHDVQEHTLREPCESPKSLHVTYILWNGEVAQKNPTYQIKLDLSLNLINYKQQVDGVKITLFQTKYVLQYVDLLKG